MGEPALFAQPQGLPSGLLESADRVFDDLTPCGAVAVLKGRLLEPAQLSLCDALG